MKSFSDVPVISEPAHRLSQIASGNDLPNTLNAKPSLFFHTDREELFFWHDQWYMIPYGGIDMVTAVKSANNIKLFKGTSLPCNTGGTYLINSDKEDDKKIFMPPPSMVQGITYNIKNIGKNRIILAVDTESSIEYENRTELVVHPKQCVSLQCLERRWYIINMYISNEL